jgi:sulfite reductase (NADPH) flavoprotein alpha-component
LYRLALLPAHGGALPAWEAGDLAQVSAPADPDHPREYSIASIPSEGRLELLVRLQRRADGSPGAASGWLCEGAAFHDAIPLRIRTHQRFRLGENARRPLIAIGNGSGLAGLRALLKARINAGVHDNWLLFGERNSAHDFLLREELQGWTGSGWLRASTSPSRATAKSGITCRTCCANRRARCATWSSAGRRFMCAGACRGWRVGCTRPWAKYSGRQRWKR